MKCCTDVFYRPEDIKRFLFTVMSYGTKIHFSTYKRENKEEMLGEARYPTSFHECRKGEEKALSTWG